MRGVDFVNLTPNKQRTVGDLLENSTRDEITVRLAGWRVRENHTRRLIAMVGATLETAMERYEIIVNLYTFEYKVINLLFL